MGCNNLWDKECWGYIPVVMNFIFHDLIGILLEVYIDDLVIKSVVLKST
jgi:hypothetical protein